MEGDLALSLHSNVSRNELTAMPVELLEKNGQLQWLSLSHNRLSVLPSLAGNAQLQELCGSLGAVKSTTDT